MTEQEDGIQDEPRASGAPAGEGAGESPSLGWVRGQASEAVLSHPLALFLVSPGL